MKPELPYTSYPVDEALVEEALASTIYRDTRHEVTTGDVVELVLAEGHTIYAGGGTCRDWLRKRQPRDLDLFVDVGVDIIHQLLRQRYPEIDPMRYPRKNGYVCIWGDKKPGELEIAALRSYRDIGDGEAFTTRYPPRQDLVENTLLMDFSINAFYYDFRARVALDPLNCGLGDIQNSILRLVTHPSALRSIYPTTLRSTQFLCRGYTPADETLTYLEENADLDVMSMGRRLWNWIPNHVDINGDGTRVSLEDFGQRLMGWLKTDEARRLLGQALSDLSTTD